MKKQPTKIDYQWLFDNMLDGLAYCQMVFDDRQEPVDFTYLEVSRNFAKLTGLKNAAGRRATKVIPGIMKSNPELFEICSRVCLTHQPERFEIYLKPVSKWFLVSVHSSRPEYFTAVFQDITRRKLLESRLEDARIAARNVFEDLNAEKIKLDSSEAKQEAMLASIADGVIALDEKGSIILMNQMAGKMLGYKISESLGRPWHQILKPEDETGSSVPIEKSSVAAALAHGKITLGHIIYFCRKDGTRFPASNTVSPIMLHGRVIGAINLFRDITREKEIDRAKTEFVSLASHQLKTPPAAIKLLTERILGGRLGTLTEKQKEYLTDIRSSNQRMIDLVNTLLSVSRIEMGTFFIQPSTKNLSHVLRDIINELKPAAGIKNLELKSRMPKENIRISIDEPLFHMVANNLITNAINYTPLNGHICVECLRIKRGQAFGGKIVRQDSIGIMVADTGYGIPKNQQNKIFTKFFRADNAREKHTDGNGLGLYIVKSVLDNSSGSIWFESRENKGSTFYVTIPTTGMRVKH